MTDSTNILEILEGCLLGDGHLELGCRSKNASFMYNSSSKDHTEFVHSKFMEFCSDNFRTVKRKETYDKRTNKTYVSYYFKTLSNPFFTSQHKRFYQNKIKIVPNDIIITDNVLLFWYIGDGELESKHGYIKLHTNSFEKNEVEFLCDKLVEFSPHVLKKQNKQYLISIPRNHVKKFLGYIGKCPINDYQHKWNFVEYKNKKIEMNGINFYESLYPNIIEDFNKGDITIYRLSKKYNVPIKAIKYHFKKNHINWMPKNMSKPIIQFGLNGDYINEWSSGNEINKKLNYNASAISECCRGTRKSYKQFIWRFKN